MENNMNLLYDLTSYEIQNNKGTSSIKAMTSALSSILIYHRKPEEILGDIYLDFIIYKKEIENKNLDKFLNFFEMDNGNNTEYNRKVLTEGLNSPIKDKLIGIITSYKLIQDYNLLEGFKRYLKLKDIYKY
jgi:hypothetical protein